MTVKLRNNLLLTGFLISVVLFLSNFVTIYILFFSNINSNRLEILKSIIHLHIMDKTIVPAVITIQGIVFLSLLVSLNSLRAYKNTEAPELYLITFFTLSFSFEALRLVNCTMFVLDTPIFLAQVITKGVYFGRIFRLMVLLSFSLYLTQFNYKRLGTLLATTFLIAFSLSSFVPVDPTSFLPDLNYQLGMINSRIFFSVSIDILIVMNILIGVLQKKYHRAIILIFYILLIIAGSSLYLHNNSFVVTNSGIVFMLIGSFLLSKYIERIYIPL